MDSTGSPLKFDLHLHSWYSDGRLSPGEVVEKCRGIGLKTVSLTDHENGGGIAEAIEAGKNLGTKVIPGMEFAAEYRGEECHILGYFIDYQNPKLKEYLEEWRKTKINQIERMVKNLQTFGFRLSLSDVLAQIRGSVDRPHISSAVFQNPENLKVLERWGVTEKRDFFMKFLMEKYFGGQALAFAKRELPRVGETLEVIHGIGGVAFWAHPLWKEKNQLKIQEKAAYFRKIGLDGLEVCYSMHTREQTLFLHQLAKDLSMYESGGSDSHGDNNAVRAYGNFLTYDLELNLPKGV